MKNPDKLQELNINLDDLANQIASEDLPEQFIENLQTFIDQNLKPLLENDQSFNPETLGKSLEKFVETELTSLAESVSVELEGAIATALQEWSDSLDSSKTSTNASDTPLIEQLISFFCKEDWSFSKEQGQSALRLAFAGDHGQWNCLAKTLEDQRQFIFYSISPLSASQSRLPEVAEFITRINYGLIIGNFELDFKDGEIRYKTSIDVEGIALTNTLIEQLVYTNVLTMDKYLPGIKGVIKDKMNPTAALLLINP